jgi:hypothetical protein
MSPSGIVFMRFYDFHIFGCVWGGVRAVWGYLEVALALRRRIFTFPSFILKNGAENSRPEARNEFKHPRNIQKFMSGRRKFRENIEKRRWSARGGFKMFIFSQNGHKDQNGHTLESPGTSKYTEILENPRRRFVFAHGGRRFTTFEASIRLF